MTDLRRNLPSIDALLSHPDVAARVARAGRQPVVSALRQALDRARASIAAGAEDVVSREIRPDGLEDVFLVLEQLARRFVDVGDNEVTVNNHHRDGRAVKCSSLVDKALVSLGLGCWTGTRT